jgi:hypothetical protein
MLQFLKVGLISAGVQLMVVAMVTYLVSFSALRELIVPAMEGSTANLEILYIYGPLTWLFPLLAMGIALTNNRFIASSAARIRHASRLMKPSIPDHAAKTLFALLGLTTAGFATLTLQEPPNFVVALSGYFEHLSTIWIMWSGFMSTGVANFGATTHAAWRAVQ